MIKSHQIKSELTNNKSTIIKKFHVTEIGLFGSCVRDTSHTDSDVDILIELKSGHKDFLNFMQLKEFLESLLQAEIDLVLKSALKPQLKPYILNEVEYV